jgi:hypothetical protein
MALDPTPDLPLASPYGHGDADQTTARTTQAAQSA